MIDNWKMSWLPFWKDINVLTTSKKTLQNKIRGNRKTIHANWRNYDYRWRAQKAINCGGGNTTRTIAVCEIMALIEQWERKKGCSVPYVHWTFSKLTASPSYKQPQTISTWKLRTPSTWISRNLASSIVNLDAISATCLYFSSYFLPNDSAWNTKCQRKYNENLILTTDSNTILYILGNTSRLSADALSVISLSLLSHLLL